MKASLPSQSLLLLNLGVYDKYIDFIRIFLMLF